MTGREATGALCADVPQEFVRIFDLALKEEHGLLYVALADLETKDLERLVEAVQLMDAEGQDALEYHEEAQR